MVSSRNILRRQKTLQRVYPEKKAVQLQTTQGEPSMYPAQTKDKSREEQNNDLMKVDYYLKPDLLILDELGFERLPGYSADDFFEIISRRYEKGSVIITTNKTFEQWGDIFSDNILASAILDRVVHYSAIIKINGSRFRAKNPKERRR